MALGIVVASSAAIGDDSLDRRLKSIAPGGRDCGRIGERGTPRPDVVACVTQQFKANKPFWARLDSYGEDSSGGLGLVLEDRGKGRGGAFFIVEFDKKGCGGGREVQAFCGTVVRECQRPQLVPANGRLEVLCKNQYIF